MNFTCSGNMGLDLKKSDVVAVGIDFLIFYGNSGNIVDTIGVKR